LAGRPAKLAEARAFAEKIGSAAVIIVQGGVVVDAWGETARKFQCHSMRKSLLSALIGIHVHAGNIDTAKTLEALGIDDNVPALTPTEKRATIATSSGPLWRVSPGSGRNRVDEARRPARGSHLPGDVLYYNNWDFNALGTIFEQATGTPIYTEFKRRIAEPLQMQDYNITDFGYVGGSDSLHPAYDFRMTARDLARFGLLSATGTLAGDPGDSRCLGQREHREPLGTRSGTAAMATCGGPVLAPGFFPM